jgi:hypothetical protein
VTVIAFVPAPEVIVPPLTVQAYPLIPASVVYTLPVEFKHTGDGPPIVGTGAGLTIIF